MSVSASSQPRRGRAHRPLPVAAPSAALASAAVAGVAVSLAAPDGAGPWVSATAGAAWLLLAAAAVAATLAVRRERAAADAAGAELRTLRSRADGLTADASHLVNVTLPSLVKRLRDGEAPDDALATATPPKDPQLRRVLHAFGVETGASEQRARGSAANAARAVRQLALAADGVDRLTAVTLPSAVAHLRRGASAETVLGELELPADPRLRVLADSVVRDLATGERRAAAAQEASAKALSRVQAKAVSMLADLREMQDRYGEEVFGDLLRLDHNTAQLGLLTDRLALLMGGRASRAWNRPIPMESILRGAVGRIASYQRVRLHSSSTAAVVGFAAEGVMHLLAELMDNATTFSPPVDEVHVYVEERTAGIVVTIEDSGLKMAGAALRRAEEAVSGRVTDLAHLQGTRLGLTVVGRLAAKYGMSVSFRPSSRGGTGVVVLFPSQLLAKPRDEEDADLVRPLAGTTAPAAPTATATGSGSSPSSGHTDLSGYPVPPAEAVPSGWAPVPADGTYAGQTHFTAAPADTGQTSFTAAPAEAGQTPFSAAPADTGIPAGAGTPAVAEAGPAHPGGAWSGDGAWTPSPADAAHPGPDPYAATVPGGAWPADGTWTAPADHATGLPAAPGAHHGQPAFTVTAAGDTYGGSDPLTGPLPGQAHGAVPPAAPEADPGHAAFTVAAADAPGQAAHQGTHPGPDAFVVTPADGAHPGQPAYRVTPADADGAGFTVTAAGPAASGAAAGAAAPVPLASAPLPAQAAVRGVATAGGLPVRPPGRTMAAADRGRPDPRPVTGAVPPAPARDAGAGFSAFARTAGRRRALGAGGATPAEGTYLPDAAYGGQPYPEPDAAPDAHPLPEPRTPHDPPGSA